MIKNYQSESLNVSIHIFPINKFYLYTYRKVFICNCIHALYFELMTCYASAQEARGNSAQSVHQKLLKKMSD